MYIYITVYTTTSHGACSLSQRSMSKICMHTQTKGGQRSVHAQFMNEWMHIENCIKAADVA